MIDVERTIAGQSGPVYETVREVLGSESFADAIVTAMDTGEDPIIKATDCEGARRRALNEMIGRVVRDVRSPNGSPR